jgi:hypothetical protein
MSDKPGTVLEDSEAALPSPAAAALPIWIRAPTKGLEHYSGLSRSYLYALAKDGKIRTRSLREPGRKQGPRLFYLPDILHLINNAPSAFAE